MKKRGNIKMIGTKKGSDPLGSKPIGKLLATYAIPSIVSMVVNALYNIVDQIFIGQGVGYLGNGATNVILPATIIAIGIGVLLGDGGAAYFSLSLGRGENERASRGAGSVITVSIISGVLFGLFSFMFLKPLCNIFGATEMILPYALDYGRIIVIGFPFVIISIALNSLIRADGSPRYAMISMITGAVINTILDPIFIFVFDWGVTGAALATILGQIVSCIISLFYLRKFKSIKMKKEYYKPQAYALKNVCGLGTSSLITQLAITMVVATLNNLLTKYGALSKYGAEIPLTTLGITMKVNQIMTSLVIGLAVGSQPIVGYNFGAGNMKRVKKTYLMTIGIATIITTIGFCLFQFFPQAVISIFGSESELYNEFAIKTLRIFLMFIMLNGFQMCTGNFFQAIGKPFKAIALSMSRQIVLLLPAAIILPVFFGVEGILYAAPVADILAFILALVLIIDQIKKLNKLEKEETTEEVEVPQI